jgi:hypothetical protein
MRYAILAFAAVLATVNWLNSADGQRTKRDLLESRDAHTRLIAEE